VDELLEEDRTWNEQLVRQVFIGIDADEVLKIKPSRTLEEDVLAWAPEKSGVFSVHWAYKLLKSEQSRRIAEKEGGGATSTRGEWWKRLSKLKIPPKVRIFWWRAINGFLPSKAELKRRHIREESHCDVCGDPSETLHHALVACPGAKRFWTVVKHLLGKQLPDLHPSTWATDLLSGAVCSKEDAAVFVCGCWALWSGRNNRMHGRSAWNPRAATIHVAGMVEELMALNSGEGQVVSRGVVQWQPPEQGWIKINCDGAFQTSTSRGAGAAVARDFLGHVIAGRAVWYGPVQEALVAEALAARDGLLLAGQLAASNVVLECDSLVLVKALQESLLDRSPIAGILHECRDLFKSFHNVKVCFIRRQGNSLADRCVKEVSADFPSVSWLACIPQWLKDAAATDCNPNMDE
jgi:ribonuclease HI